MDLRQLEYVVAVADSLSFTRAAEQCHVVQSALSHEIQRLEAELDTRLFERTSRSVRTTPASELLVAYARRIFVTVGEARVELDALAGLERGELAVGATQTAGRVLDVIALFGTFHRQHSGIKLTSISGPAFELAEAVRTGVLDPRRPVALTVDSGDVVSYPNTWTQWGNKATFGMSFAEREPLRRQFPSGPYSNVGPVEVRGAEPGDVLECRMLTLRTIDWGWNSFPLGVGALPSDFDEPYVHYFRFEPDRRHAEFVDGIRIPLAPSMGVFAVEPEGEEPVSAILAGPHGGNLDLGEMVAGTSLFLPVFKSGARVWVGDANAAQGDGVVDQTSIETAMEELRVQYRVHKHVTLGGPIVETPTHWIVLAFADSLDNALTACVRAAIEWLNTHGQLDRRDAYALCSMAVSFRVTQLADQTGSVYTSVPPKTIHAMIPKHVLGERVLDHVERSMRPGS